MVRGMEQLEKLRGKLKSLPHRDKTALEDLIMETTFFIKSYVDNQALIDELNKIPTYFYPHTPAIARESDFESSWRYGRNALSQFYDKLKKALQEWMEIK